MIHLLLTQFVRDCKKSSKGTVGDMKVMTWWNIVDSVEMGIKAVEHAEFVLWSQNKMRWLKRLQLFFFTTIESW